MESAYNIVGIYEDAMGNKLKFGVQSMNIKSAYYSKPYMFHNSKQASAPY
jgi:hypothetical protein